eukprot:12906998-Prorocentrum_lima.AAC.1
MTSEAVADSRGVREHEVVIGGSRSRQSARLLRAIPFSSPCSFADALHGYISAARSRCSWIVNPPRSRIFGVGGS